MGAAAPAPAPCIRHCYISEIVEDRWVHVARRLTSIEFSFDPCNIYRDCPRGVPSGQQNVVTKRSRVLLKTSHSKPIYRYISVAEPELYNGGADGRGDGSGEGAVPPHQKKMNFHQKMVGILVNSKMTFYVYAKIGQVNGGHQPRPLDPPLLYFRNC